MKRHILNIALVMLSMTLITAGFTSCSSDETHEGLAGQEQTRGQEPEDPNSARIRAELKTEMLLNALCKVDSTMGSAVYTPRLGEPIYSATPTVCYTVANTAEEAEAAYQNIVSVLADGSGAPVGHDVCQGDVHLTFSVGADANETGRLTVDCPRLKDVMTALIFVPEAVWPENITSPVPFMSILWNKQNYRAYICLREPFGCKGMLLTFDGGWRELHMKSYWQDDFRMLADCAGLDVFNCLGCAMNSRADAFEAMVKAANERLEEKNKTRNMLNKLFTEGKSVTFDCDYNFKQGYWWFGTNFYIDKNMAKFANRKYRIESGYWEHKAKPSMNEPSSAIYFDRKFKVGTEWEFIYKPGVERKRNRG